MVTPKGWKGRHSRGGTSPRECLPFHHPIEPSSFFILSLTRHFLDETDFFFAVGGVVRAEEVVEPEVRLFREGNGLAVLHCVPGILALLLAVHEAIAKASYLILLEVGEDGGVIRSACAGHPLRTKDRPVVWLAVFVEPDAVAERVVAVERDDVAVLQDKVGNVFVVGTPGG